MSTEQQFAALVAWLRENGHQNPQAVLRTLDAADVPEQYRGALAFWRTLSGPSRNLMYNVACGRQTRKTHAPERRGHRLPVRALSDRFDL